MSRAGQNIPIQLRCETTGYPRDGYEFAGGYRYGNSSFQRTGSRGKDHGLYRKQGL